MVGRGRRRKFLSHSGLYMHIEMYISVCMDVCDRGQDIRLEKRPPKVPPLPDEVSKHTRTVRHVLYPRTQHLWLPAAGMNQCAGEPAQGTPSPKNNIRVHASRSQRKCRESSCCANKAPPKSNPKSNHYGTSRGVVMYGGGQVLNAKKPSRQEVSAKRCTIK
jgi:hypothetical protein